MTLKITRATTLNTDLDMAISQNQSRLPGPRRAMLLAILSFTPLFFIPNSIAHAFLASHWAFDEGFGSVASDQSGNSHDATLLGPMWDIGRIGAHSVSLDGFDDFIEIINPSPLRIASGNYSFFAWITTTNPDFETIIADRNTGSTGEGFFFRVGKSAGDGKLFIHLGSGVERKQYSTSSTNLADGSWHHVGFTWENVTDTLRLYVDGALVTDVLKSVDHPLAGDSIGSTNNMEIGRRPNNAQHFQGGIDDVRIFRSVLSTAEIQTLFSGGPTINILEPNGGDTADESFTITWTDDDPDHDASIALYYDLDNAGADGTLIVSGLSEDDETDQHLWDVSELAQAAYYVYGEIDNGIDPIVTNYSSGTVIVVHGSSGDNLGNHIATQNIQLNGNTLSNDGDNEGLFVDTAGNTGIGTTNPQKRLHIVGSNETNAGLLIENTLDTAAKAAIRKHSDSNLWIESSENDNQPRDMVFRVHGSAGGEAVRILGNGNVGIGTSSPSEPLDVAGRTQTDDLTIDNRPNCGRLFTDSVGNVLCGEETQGTGDITGVLAGPGLSGGGTSGEVAVKVDTSQVQARVAGSCTVGQTIQAINEDGTVICAGSNSNGPKLCPSGFIGINDQYCIEEQLNEGQMNWFQANRTCMQKNARLCSVAEWHFACEELNIVSTGGDDEWTGNNYREGSSSQLQTVTVSSFMGSCDSFFAKTVLSVAHVRCCFSR